MLHFLQQERGICFLRQPHQVDEPIGYFPGDVGVLHVVAGQDRPHQTCLLVENGATKHIRDHGKVAERSRLEQMLADHGGLHA